MTAPELADCYVPVPLRWAHVQPGDVIVGNDGRLLYVASISPARRELLGPARRDARLSGYPRPFPVQEDDPVTVLMSATEHDAMTLMRDQLGAQLIERRTA